MLQALLLPSGTSHFCGVDWAGEGRTRPAHLGHIVVLVLVKMVVMVGWRIALRVGGSIGGRGLQVLVMMVVVMVMAVRGRGASRPLLLPVIGRPPWPASRRHRRGGRGARSMRRH